MSASISTHSPKAQTQSHTHTHTVVPQNVFLDCSQTDYRFPLNQYNWRKLRQAGSCLSSLNFRPGTGLLDFNSNQTPQRSDQCNQMVWLAWIKKPRFSQPFMAHHSMSHPIILQEWVKSRPTHSQIRQHILLWLSRGKRQMGARSVSVFLSCWAPLDPGTHHSVFYLHWSMHVV